MVAVSVTNVLQTNTSTGGIQCYLSCCIHTTKHAIISDTINACLFQLIFKQVSNNYCSYGKSKQLTSNVWAFCVFIWNLWRLLHHSPLRYKCWCFRSTFKIKLNWISSSPFSSLTGFRYLWAANSIKSQQIASYLIFWGSISRGESETALSAFFKNVQEKV